MKDKLYKTGHKKAYYRVRRAMRLSLFALAAGLSTAAPILITYGVSVAQAEAKQVVESEEQPSSETSEAALLSYNF